MIPLVLLGAVLSVAPAAGMSDPSQAAEELFARLQATSMGSSHAGKAGEWITLRVHGETSAAFFRFAVLSDEKLPDGRLGRWFELAFGMTPDSAVLAAKYLSGGAPGERAQIVRTVVRIAGGPAQELSPSAVKNLRRDAKPPAFNLDSVPHTPERKTVAAGTFDCERLDLSPGTLWVSPQAPLFHLVAGELSGNVFELYDSGTRVADWVGEPEVRAKIRDGGLESVSLDGGRP